MAFREYGNYDGIGLADLVRQKQVSAAELLDEAIARTAKVDPEINAVVVKHYDYARRQIDRGLPDGPFTGVPFLLKDLDLLETHANDFRRECFQGERRRSYRHPRPAFSRQRGHDLRKKRQSGIRIAADHRVPSVRSDPKPLESGALVRRFFRRRGGCCRRAHSSRGPCQRRRRFDTHSRLGIRRVRNETEPRAQSARPRIAAKAGAAFPAVMS